MPKALDLALLALFLVGAFFAWDAGRERARLQAAQERILSKVRDRTAADPSRVRVVPIDTGEALHFQWLVQVPVGVQVELTSRAGSVARVEKTEKRPAIDGVREMYVGVRLREQPSGDLYLERRLPRGGDGHGVQFCAPTKPRRGDLGRIRVEGLAAAGGLKPVILDDPQRPVVLVRLTLPDDVLAEAKQFLHPRLYARIAPVLCEITLRPFPPEEGTP